MSYVQRRRFLWILLIIGLVLIAITASATSMAPLRFDYMVQKSVAVARLRCLGAKSLWDRGEIWTDTRFAVVQQEKGTLPAELTVRLLGGTLGNLHSHVDEVPSFQVGEEVYLFLWSPQDEPTYRVLGWSQGTFRILRDARSGAESVTQDSAASPMFDPQSHTFRRSGIRNLPMAAFREKLHRALLGAER